MDSLSLSDCRITQSQESHIKKGNGSMYAIDIACTKGQSFKVYTPDYFDTYVIEYIGVDKRLGNFIIIKHGDYRFVYGHTQTDLNVGDRLSSKQILGSIDKSGISQNYHLHIELWKRNSNINWHHITGGELIVNPKSFDLRVQRGLVSDKEINQKILDFIASFEGCHLTAYWDVKQWSIGYGTRSYEGETITKEEANKRARQVIQNIRTKYNLSQYPLDTQIALTSFAYNIGSIPNKIRWLLSNGYISATKNEILKYNNAGGKELKGLSKRRQAEAKLIY